MLFRGLSIFNFSSFSYHLLIINVSYKLYGDLSVSRIYETWQKICVYTFERPLTLQPRNFEIPKIYLYAKFPFRNIRNLCIFVMIKIA